MYGELGGGGVTQPPGIPPISVVVVTYNRAQGLNRTFFRRWRFDSPVYGTAIIRRSALETVSFPNADFRHVADVDLWLRLAERLDVAYIDMPLASLVSRTSAPQDWGVSAKAKRRLVRKIFRDARNRHWRSERLRRVVEIIRHEVFSVVHESFYMAAGARRAVLRTRKQPRP